jgi:beta-phosphoglucomutase-like phosphatase (HAD superfamily)
VYRAGVSALPGVHEMVRTLHVAQHKQCVASSSDFPHLDLVLGNSSLRRFFSPHIFSATQVTRGKPEPDLFLFAAARMGVAPARTPAGLSSTTAQRAGVAAGMTVFGYHGAVRHADLSTFGAQPIEDMRALETLLGV